MSRIHDSLGVRNTDTGSSVFSIYKTAAICLPVAILAAASALAQSQKLPPRAEIDKVLNEAVRQFNVKMSGTKVDEMTSIRIMTYDEATPTIAYHYTTLYLAKNKIKKVTPEYIASIRRFNTEKTCTSQFEPLMRAYGLEVVHSFSDAVTGANLLHITITSVDCARRN